MYDPDVLVRPVTRACDSRSIPETRPELRPMFNTCTDTNGPSAKIFMDERGQLNERLMDDPLYWNSADPRPWGTYLNESDRRYQRYRATQGR